MANALGIGSPDAPDLGAQQQQSSALAPQAAPQMPVVAAPGGSTMAPGAPGGAQPAPAPSHEQAVAALRHFEAVRTELRELLQNPDCGRADLKSAIIDGATKLVATRIISPAQAVMQLANVPERPYDQRKWLETQYQQTVQAESAVLDQHRSAHIGSGVYADEATRHQSNPDDHMNTIGGMMDAHYGNGARS